MLKRIFLGEKLIEEFKVSVVIPTLNRKNFLKKAIESVSKQTFSPHEIIVVDNGSSDGTLEMVNNEYPSVKTFVQNIPGVSATRNLGIKMSEGNWVAFLDSDDQWHHEKLKLQLESISQEENEVFLSHTDETWYREEQIVNQKLKHRKRGGFIFEFCLPLCCISPSSSLVKKEIFDQIGFFDESLEVCEDYDFWLRYCSKYPVNFVDKKLTFKFGGHLDQLSKKNWGMDRYRISALEKLIGSNSLEKDQFEMTAKTLMRKISIIVDGAKKRSNQQVSDLYNEKKIYWLDQLKK